MEAWRPPAKISREFRALIRPLRVQGSLSRAYPFPLVARTSGQEDPFVLNARHPILALAASCITGAAVAQCPQLYDYYGVPSSAPTWYSCSGTSFTLLVATPQTVGAFTIDWGDGSAPHSGASLAPPQSVAHVYTAAVAQYTVTFSEIATGCTITGTVVMEESTSASIQIPVGGLTQVCAPQAVEFINSSTNVSPNTVFTWDFGDNSPLLVVDHTNLGQTISHTYMPGTVSCETTVRLSAENTCNTLQGGPSQATFNPIRIWDLDTAQITPSATLLCWPDNEVTFLNTTRRNCLNQGNIYQRFEYWNFGDYWGAGHDSIIDWQPWPPTFPHTIAYPGIGTYEVVLLDSNYCGIDTARIQITIVPPPTVTLTTSPDTVCAGTTAVFHQTTDGGANYFQWDFGTGNGFQWTGAGDQSHTYNAPGTYTVQYTASIQGATPGCTDTASVQIVVLPSPTADLSVDNAAACNSLTTAFTNNSVGGVQYHWDFGNGTTSTQMHPPPVTYDAVGPYTITLTVRNAQGCEDAATQVVNVYGPPDVQIGAQNVCEGSPAQFTDLTVTEPGNPIISWNWDLGDGTTSTDASLAHTYAGGGTYTVTLDVSTPYCSGSGTLPVTVESKPSASVDPLPSLGCSPMVVALQNTSTGATNAIWTFGDGGGSTNWSDTHTYLNLGTQDTTYTVQLVVTTAFGCSDTAQASITVAPSVMAMFVHDAQPGCAPVDVQFTNNSTGATAYLWDFGDGTTSTAVSPAHQYVNNTQFLSLHTVTLIATSPAGCADTTTQQIMVYPMPNFTFVAQPDSGCSPLAVTFPSVVGAVSYQWDFGDGSTGSGPSPTHTYLNTTTNSLVLPVTLVAMNAFGCSDTAYSSVTVHPNPTAQIELDENSGCHPFTTSIANLSIGATSYQWTYGDGGTSTTTQAVHDHTWYNYAGPDPINFPVTLTASTDHGCTSTTTAQVQVFPAVQAAFITDSIGCAPLASTFTNISTGASQHAWTFGDGQFSNATSPTHTYQNQGLADMLFEPVLVVTSAYGCTDTATAQVIVHPQPIAQFAPTPLAGCQPLPVTFQDQSIGATDLHWEFGDGQFADGGPGNVEHTYTNTGSDPVHYTQMLIATSVHGCTDTAHRQVQVYPYIQALFSTDTAGCSPHPVQLVDQSQGAVNHLWNMGDGTQLIGATPTHTYVNSTTSVIVRTITLTATSTFGCTSTWSQDVHVYPTPMAAFQATPFQQQYPNATVNIANNSLAGPWNYAWTFGDGDASAQQHPGSHTYATWGTYEIVLVVSNPFCADTATQTVEITAPLPTAGFTGGGDGCAPLTVAFTNTSLMAEGYLWQFGDGSTSTADNPVYTYTVPGTYTVSLTAYGPGGTISTSVQPNIVTVRPRANAYFVLQPDHVVVPSQPVFTYNLSANATNYWWDFGDGTTSTEMNPVHYYTNGGTFDVTLVANNQWNCPDTFTVVSAVTGEVAGDIRFPNAFTPNNNGPTDGVYDPQSYDNDHFFPLYSGVEDYRLEIFNRWGELLFVTEDPRIGWDGWYRGRPAKQDVYVWKAYAKFSDGRETVLKGDVTLIR
jgi:gliding motility-associated-like protein